VVYEELSVCVAYEAVPCNDPVNPKVEIVDPVIASEPVIIAEPVYGKVVTIAEPVLTVIGNVDPSPLVNVIVFEDTEAVVSNEPVFVTPPPPPFRA